MKKMARGIAALSLVTVLCFDALASQEDVLVWKQVQITFGESAETGRIGLSANGDKNGLTALEITAFGQTFAPAPEHIAKIRQFPLESLKVSREVEHEKTGGHAIHFKFQREYYDKVNKLMLVREEAVLTVTKAGLTISIRPR